MGLLMTGDLLRFVLSSGVIARKGGSMTEEKISNSERQRRIRNQIAVEQVKAEARERLSSLPPGTMDREPAPVLTGKPGSG